MSTPNRLEQLLLPLREDFFARDEHTRPLPKVLPEDLDGLHQRLASLLGESIDLIGTKNRNRLLSQKRLKSGIRQIRIQEQLALGGPEIERAIARFLLHGDPAADRKIREFARGFQLQMGPGRARYSHPAGRHQDLRDYLTEENHRWFEGKFRGRIGWSRMNPGQVRKRIRLGSWSEQHQLIRVHPALDTATTPDYVLRFVVFHEMLHALLGAEESGGRRRFHGPQFKKLEVEHPDHDRAEEWIERNTERLLSF